MSRSQYKILNRLLAAASESPQHTRVAAAICRGSKVLAININNHRSIILFSFFFFISPLFYLCSDMNDDDGMIDDEI